MSPPGAARRRARLGMLGGAALLAALALPAAAQPAADSGADTDTDTSADTGAAAFERRDFVAAAGLWRAEAAAGSARAKLGLGLIHDLGLGVPRDAAKALRWYLEAAEDGMAPAQFNVGVMLDAGAGAPRDPVAAAVWYARAAANGHRRAAYNLGLLYETGEGVPANPDLARHWLGRAAAALPAAAERLETLAEAEPETRQLASPRPLVGALVAEDGARRAELVWAAGPGPAGAAFLVEIARLPAADETAGAVVAAHETAGSALTAALPPRSASYAWRVSRVDPAAARYAAGPWQRLAGREAPGAGEDTAEDTAGTAGPDPALPLGRVTLAAAADDAPALRLARELAESFASGALWARVVPDAAGRDAGDRPGSGVRYAYAEDAALAAAIAIALPVLDAEDAVHDPASGAAPGEIRVRLVGGPREP